MNTGTEEHTKELEVFYKKVHLGRVYTSPSTLIGGDPRKNDTVDMKEAQGNKAYTLEVPPGAIRYLQIGSDNDSDDASVHSEPTIPQQQRNIQPQIITTVSNNNAKFPYLKKDEYEVWAMKMEYWITNNDMNI
ncbi:hypothetical protein Tco_0331991 [Tanacetum coccineum]